MPATKRSVGGGTLSTVLHKALHWTLPRNKVDGCPEMTVIYDNRYQYVTIVNRNTEHGASFSPRDIDKLIMGLQAISVEMQEMTRVEKPTSFDTLLTDPVDEPSDADNMGVRGERREETT